MKIIKIASAQFVITNDIQKNTNIMIKLLHQAAKQKARFVLFPECALTGYTGSEIPNTNSLKSAAIDDALKLLGQVTKKLHLYAGIGTAYFHKNAKTWTNSLVVLTDKGKQQCMYHKMALTRGDEFHFIAGESHPTFTIDKVVFGMQICFDVRFPENYREYFKKGVHVVAHAYHQTGIPEIAAQRRSLMTAFQRVRSSENGIYTISSNSIGKNKGVDQWVPTMILNPRGDILKECAPDKTGVIVVEINADDIYENVEADIRRYSAKFLNLKKLPKREILHGKKIR